MISQGVLFFMQKILFTFFLLLFITNLRAQKSDTNQKEKSIFNLLESYKASKDSSTIKKALSLAYETKNDSIIRETNIVYGIESYRKNDLKNLQKSNINLLKHFLKSKDSLSLAKHFHYKALLFRKKYITDSCFYYYHKSKNISILLKDSLAAGRRLLSMARVQYGERDYLGSEITSIEALSYLEPIKANRYISHCYNNLGVILSNTGKYEKARLNYQKAFNFGYEKRELKLLSTFINYHLNTAVTYQKSTAYKSSNEIYFKILVDSIKIKRPSSYYNILEGISYNNFKLGKNKAALDGFLQVLNYRKSINDSRGLSVTHSVLAEFYLNQKNYNVAKRYALKGLKGAKETNFTKRILENYQYLSRIEKGEKGKEYLRKYISLNDSLLTNERNLKDQFAKVRYETEKKNIENKTLKTENDKKQLQIEKEQQQKLIGWLLAGASLLFIAFSFVIVSNRRKKIEYQSKLKQVEVREKERQQIAKSLHDEVAGDIRMLHKKLIQNNLVEESKELDKVKENVRTLSHQLSSVSFDEVSFKNQIINLVSDYFDADFFIKVKEINTVQWKEVNNSIKRTLFLCIRESIQNIDKYAAAKNVILSFNETKKSVFLMINDDGKGFDIDKKKKGIGLKNMKERVEEINGVFSIKSALEKGTTIEIQIPKNGK